MSQQVNYVLTFRNWLFSDSSSLAAVCDLIETMGFGFQALWKGVASTLAFVQWDLLMGVL